MNKKIRIIILAMCFTSSSFAVGAPPSSAQSGRGVSNQQMQPNQQQQQNPPNQQIQPNQQMQQNLPIQPNSQIQPNQPEQPNQQIVTSPTVD